MLYWWEESSWLLLVKDRKLIFLKEMIKSGMDKASVDYGDIEKLGEYYNQN